MLTKRSKYAGNLVLALAVFFLGAVSIATCFDADHLFASLLVHMRFQILVAQAFCGVLLACLRNWPMVAACLALSAVNIFAVAPYFVPVLGRASDGATLKICQVNVNYGNDKYDKVIDYIKHCNPDVILVEEMTDKWEAALKGALPEYGQIMAVPQAGAFGIGTFSKLPITGGEVRHYGGLIYPALVCRIRWNGKDVEVIHVHTISVDEPANMLKNKLQLADLAKDEGLAGGDVVVAGDFNATIWSAPMQHLLASAGLHNSADGFGWQPGWPRDPKPWAFIDKRIRSFLLMIMIDHCLVGKNLVVKNYAVGGNVGSDHSPICVELGRRG